MKSGSTFMFSDKTFGHKIWADAHPLNWKNEGKAYAFEKKRKKDVLCHKIRFSILVPCQNIL